MLYVRGAMCWVASAEQWTPSYPLDCLQQGSPLSPRAVAFNLQLADGNGSHAYCNGSRQLLTSISSFDKFSCLKFR